MPIRPMESTGGEMTKPVKAPASMTRKRVVRYFSMVVRVGMGAKLSIGYGSGRKRYPTAAIGYFMGCARSV